MRGKARWSIFVSILLVLSLFLAACGGASSNKGSDKKSGSSNELADNQVLYLYNGSDIPTLDYTQATDTTSGDALSMLKAGLMVTDNNQLKPDMAASEPKVSADGLTYTFTLRDAKWSDGSPVTAQDFVYGWHHELDPKTAAPYSFIYASANIKNAAKILDQKSDLYGKVDQLGIKALDDKTLQITLEKATPYFLSLMSFQPFFPAKQSFVEKQGDKYAKEPENLLYNGPFTLAKWDHGQGWTFKKNPNYWDAKNITLNEVDVKVVKDETTSLNLYKTDKVYTKYLSAEYVDEYKNSPEFNTIPMSCVAYLKLNIAKVPAFQNEKVRKALYMAIDRKGITDILLKNGSIPARFFVPKNFTKGPDGKDFRAAAPDGYLKGGKDEATKLWNEAKKELNIKTLNLEYLTTDSDTASKFAEYDANQIEKAMPGVKVTINKQPWGEYLKKDDNGNYQIGGGASWCPDYQDPMTFLDMWTSTNQNNTGKWSNPEYDKLISDAANLGNKPAERWKKLQEAEKLLLTNAVIVPEYQLGRAVLVKPYVKGLVFQSYGALFDFRHVKIMKH
jgi:oligopeptide transport system substrate-binding protein